MTSTASQEHNGRELDREAAEASKLEIPDDDSSDVVMGAEEEEGDNQQRMAHVLKKEESKHNENDDSTDISTPFGKVHNEAEAAQLVEEDSLPPEPQIGTPPSDASFVSGPDDTPSLKVHSTCVGRMRSTSLADTSKSSIRSSPSNGVQPSRASSRLGISQSPQPFDHRFKARVSSSSPVPRSASPAFLTSHSRQVSVSSQLTLRSQEEELHEKEQQLRPWEVVRWTRLKKISHQAFSESGKRAFGRPTFLTIGASIAIGTSKGIILLFDYQQTLKSIIGQGTAAAECGAVTALAISADHSTVAGGHKNGTIFTWDLSRPAKPFLHIQPLNRTNIRERLNDGHLTDSAILHVGFLGQRHTAIASADENGMAFSHLATRGLGALGRTVKSTRILGRYPDSSHLLKKPSSVMAFGTLPLGNVEQATDDFGLTALLTPYLLVIISTTPVAQTQYKAPRLKDVAAHSAMTGCLAWFPSVKLKDTSKDDASRTKLVYCWSNILNVLEIHERSHDDSEHPEKRTELDFLPSGRWTCDEAILVVQWLSRSMLAVLTITQRLIILEDKTFRVADSADLNAKHIHHEDLFSRQLQPLVDRMEQGDGAMHGVIPDAYHMSFKVFKGRLFLLGMSDIGMGTLSNWADRLTATIEAGNPITAIELALLYYTGETDKVTIGLPDDEVRRHALVKEKLLDLLSGSLAYILNDESNRVTESGIRNVLQEFADVAFRACAVIGEIDYLFDEVYEHYSDASMQDVFLFELEQYIIDSRVEVVPTIVLKDLMVWYESMDLGDRLQVIICSLQTSTMDIDQVSEVCKRMRLFDALIYVWNQALDDFVTPLIDLMALIPGPEEEISDDDSVSRDIEASMKMFPYMAYSLTGRRYPGGEEMPEPQALKAKQSIYSFLFSSRQVHWPPKVGKQIRPQGSENVTDYPYLHSLLAFEPFSLLSMLNESFEDSYLSDEIDTQLINGALSETDLGASLSSPVTRPRIINILLEVITPSSFEPADKLLLDIFVARNLAKFPQDILLSSSILRQTLVELCNNLDKELKEECQLSVEYLLTVYTPSDTQELIALLSKAKYYRALKSTFRSSRQYARWLESYFDDPDDRDGVFTCIGDCLRTGSGLSKRQIIEVKSVISNYASDLMVLDAANTATTLQTYAPDLLPEMLESASEDSYLEFLFLQTLLEPKDHTRHRTDSFGHRHQALYVTLMCRHQPQHVADYITLVDSGDLRLDEVLPAMESSNVVDAAVILLQHDGLARRAMDRLITHLETVRVALTSLLEGDSPDAASTEEAAADILQEMEKYVKLGIWLCQGEATQSQQSAPASPQAQRRPKISLQYQEDDLTSVELLWLDLVDTTISLHQAMPADSRGEAIRGDLRLTSAVLNAAFSIRNLVQSTFTALLSASITASTVADTAKATQLSRQASNMSLRQTSAPRFPPLLSTLLSRLSSNVSSTATVLPLLSNLLSSHAFESSILSLAQSFLDKDVFALVQDADAKRRRGWRPAGRSCEICGRRCWGPGAGVKIWDAWKQRPAQLQLQRISETRPVVVQHEEESRGRTKGKARASESVIDEITKPGSGLETKGQDAEALVVFSCQHLYHRGCLTKASSGIEQEAAGVDRYICPICR